VLGVRRGRNFGRRKKVVEGQGLAELRRSSTATHPGHVTAGRSHTTMSGLRWAPSVDDEDAGGQWINGGGYVAIAHPACHGARGQLQRTVGGQARGGRVRHGIGRGGRAFGAGDCRRRVELRDMVPMAMGRARGRPQGLAEEARTANTAAVSVQQTRRSCVVVKGSERRARTSWRACGHDWMAPAPWPVRQLFFAEPIFELHTDCTQTRHPPLPNSRTFRGFDIASFFV
jgi:hypothetical protein